MYRQFLMDLPFLLTMHGQDFELFLKPWTSCEVIRVWGYIISTHKIQKKTKATHNYFKINRDVDNDLIGKPEVAP